MKTNFEDFSGINVTVGDERVIELRERQVVDDCVGIDVARNFAR